MIDLEALTHSIQSADWKTALAAADQFATLEADTVLPILLPLLQSTTACTRNAIALALRDLGDDRAVESLLVAILHPLNPRQRGTLAYALEPLDCSQHFRSLFELALTDNFEVQQHALSILSTQSFVYSLDDLQYAQSHLDAYEQRTNHANHSELLLAELREVLNGFSDQN